MPIRTKKWQQKLSLTYQNFSFGNSWTPRSVHYEVAYTNGWRWLGTALLYATLFPPKIR